MKQAQSYHQSLVEPVSWDAIPGGSSYRHTLEGVLKGWWKKILGFCLLKLGALSVDLDTSDCMITYQLNVGREGERFHVLANLYQLPFSNKSVDACLLSHTLSYISDPHRLLREVDRVLIDDGWLIITTFNPVSILGLGKFCPILSRRQPFISRMYTQIHILDWLGILNFEVLYRTHLKVLPWRCKGMVFLSSHFPAIRCLSVIIARKRTVPLSPLFLKDRPIGLRQSMNLTKRHAHTPYSQYPPNMAFWRRYVPVYGSFHFLDGLNDLLSNPIAVAYEDE